MRSEEEWAEVVRQTLERHGRIDVLVNNAGIFQRAKLLDTDLEPSTGGSSTSTRSACSSACGPSRPTMIDQRSRSIVNISSVAGLRGFPGRLRLRRLEVRRHAA